MKSRFKPTSRALLFWTLFIGIGAVGGALMMLTDPTGKSMGMDAMLPYFQVLPFADMLFCNLLFSGIALLIVNGLTNLTAAVLLFCKRKSGIVLGGVFGVTLMLWICIQFYMFPPNFMSTVYFIFGALQAITGYMAYVFYLQEHQPPLPEHDPRIGTDPRHLVVYFSRMGYVRRQAYEEAARTGARLFEIRTPEKTDGTLGFWWCGRFGMHRWEMPVEALPEDLSSYDRVTICSPIWVFSLCAPVRGFCRAAAGKIKQADYVLVHFTPGKYEGAAAEMDRLLGLTHTALTDVQCHMGRIRRRTVLTADGKQITAEKA